MDDLILARIEPNVDDVYLTDFRLNLFQQGEDDGDPPIPLNLEHQVSQDNLSLLAES